MKYKILNFEWNSSGRDIDIVEPIFVYLEFKYEVTIQRENYSNAVWKILKYKPDLVLISNATGSPENVELAKMTNSLGIKLVTLTSEGDYVVRRNSIDQFFWGWNTERVCYSNLHLEWSQKNISLIKKYIPEASNFTIKLSGASGFDKYKILEYFTKEKLIKKYKKKRYEKVIGIAAWGFDLYFDEDYQTLCANQGIVIDQDIINFHKISRNKLNLILEKLIVENKNILFILKHHPGLLKEEFTEFFGLNKYDNVLIIKGRDENIADIINASDLWIAYESTTCLEAWLLGKQTMLINPLGANFERSEIAKGSPIKENFIEVQEAIDSFYDNGMVKGFKELEDKRKKIVEDIIQWADGKNHIRAGEYIYELLINMTKPEKHISCWEIKKIIKAIGKYLISNSFLKNSKYLSKKIIDLEYFNTIYSYEERIREYEKYKAYLRIFYDKNGTRIN